MPNCDWKNMKDCSCNDCEKGEWKIKITTKEQEAILIKRAYELSKIKPTIKKKRKRYIHK